MNWERIRVAVGVGVGVATVAAGREAAALGDVTSGLTSPAAIAVGDSGVEAASSPAMVDASGGDTNLAFAS